MEYNLRKRRNYTFNVTLNQFADRIKPCHYCGELVSDGIDRKDNDIGYEIDNCLLCCYKCNTAKMVMNYDEFKLHIKSIYKHMELGEK